DDIQWLDAPSARTLGFAFRRLANDRVGLLATRRLGTRVADDPAGAFPPGRVTHEQVGPLDQTALVRIVQEPLALTLPRAQLRALDDASGGNPFFAIELARSVQAGKTRLVPGAPPALAPSLKQLIASHLDQVSPDVADALLTVAARIDPTVDDLGIEVL